MFKRYINLAIKARAFTQTLSRHPKRKSIRRRYPSFVGLKPASDISSHSKRSNRSRGTRHELLLMRELKRLGLTFKKYVKDLPGKPDIVFPDEHLAVFCDGDFWHGRNWRSLSRKLIKGTNGEYWKSKIASNIKRDKIIDKTLKLLGWDVIRFWETDIHTLQNKIADDIFNTLRGKND